MDCTLMVVESPRALSMWVVDNWASVDYTIVLYFQMSIVGDAELNIA